MFKIKNLDNIQVISNLLSQFMLNGVNFLLIIIFTHFLTTYEYGIVSVYMAYVSIVSIMIGLTTHGSIGVALSHINGEEYNNYLSSILLLSCISFVFFLLCTYIFKNSLIYFTQLDSFLLFMILLHGFGISCYNFLSMKFVFLRKSQYLCIISFFLVCVMLFLSWYGIYYHVLPDKQYMVRILSLAIPYILCSVFAVLTTIVNAHPLENFKENVKFCLPICIPLMFHGLSHIVLSHTDKIMLQKLFLDNSVVGVYSFIVTFTHVLSTISVAFNNSWVPLFYNFLKFKQYYTIYKRTKQYTYIFTLLVLGFLMVVPEFVYVLARKDYWQGLYILPIITLAIYMAFLYLFPVNFELYHKESRVVACGTFGAAACNIILNYFFIPKYEMYGAAIATFISYLLLLLFHMYFANKIDNGSYPYNKFFFIKYIIMILLGCIVYYICFNYLLIRWGLAFVISVLIVRQVQKNKRIF